MIYGLFAGGIIGYRFDTIRRKHFGFYCTIFFYCYVITKHNIHYCRKSTSVFWFYCCHWFYWYWLSLLFSVIESYMHTECICSPTAMRMQRYPFDITKNMSSVAQRSVSWWWLLSRWLSSQRICSTISNSVCWECVRISIIMMVELLCWCWCETISEMEFGWRNQRVDLMKSWSENVRIRYMFLFCCIFLALFCITKVLDTIICI